MNTILKAHADGENDREQWIVLTTWFQGGDPRVAMMSGVQSDGHVSVWRYVHEYAVQNGRGKDLVADELAELQRALDTMPPAQWPELADLLIVSVRHDGRWTTHVYDRTIPPPAIATAFAMMGAPIEPPLAQ